MTEHMRIISLSAENVKKLSAVYIEPDGSVVQITGPNGHGKTSVLDSIWWALGGSADIQAAPIRQGEERASITIELGDDKPQLIVERTFIGENTYLQVKTPEGAKFPSPQKMLDELVGALSFDPLEFMRMKPPAQRDLMEKFCRLDFTELDQAQETDREARKLARHDRDLAVAKIEGMREPNIQGPRVDLTAMRQALDDAYDHNAKIPVLAGDVKNAEAAQQRLQKELEELRERHDKKLLEVKQAEVTLKTALADLEKCEEIPVDDVRKRIDEADLVNKEHDYAEMFEECRTERAAAEDKFEKLDDAIKERAAERVRLMAAAKMPVKGLALGTDQVFFNELPLNQASDGMQLRISTAIAASFNPKLRIIRIRDGSLLDDNAMIWLDKFCEQQNFQVWIERVDTSGEVGIVMEDGHVKGQQLPEQPAATEEGGAS